MVLVWVKEGQSRVLIFENYLHGRKRALWLSVSNDLRVDAERDLRDIRRQQNRRPPSKIR